MTLQITTDIDSVGKLEKYIEKVKKYSTIQNSKEFKKYLNSLADKDNYLQGIKLKVNVKVQEYL